MKQCEKWCPAFLGALKTKTTYGESRAFCRSELSASEAVEAAVESQKELTMFVALKNSTDGVVGLSASPLVERASIITASIWDLIW